MTFSVNLKFFYFLCISSTKPKTSQGEGNLIRLSDGNLIAFEAGHMGRIRSLQVLSQLRFGARGAGRGGEGGRELTGNQRNAGASGQSKTLNLVLFYGCTFLRTSPITTNAYRFGMNFAEPAVSKMTEVYQTVHMKELTHVPENDQDDPKELFTDIHFWGRSTGTAHEAYHLSYGLSYQ